MGRAALRENAVRQCTFDEYVCRGLGFWPGRPVRRRHPPKPYNGCNAKCATLKAVSTQHWMRTPRAKKASFYLWRRDLLKRLLTADEYLLIETLYGLDKPANFEGRWNLHRSDAWRSVVARLSLEEATARAILERAKEKMFEARSARARPATDTKVLTAWNGLLVGSLADAGMPPKRAGLDHPSPRQRRFYPRCLLGRRRAVRILARGSTPADRLSGRLCLPSRRPHEAAAACDGANRTSNSPSRWRIGCSAISMTLTRAVFILPPMTKKRMIYRPKPTMDDALPPGNGLAAQSLLHLGHLLADERYIDAAHETIAWAPALIEQVPLAHCTLINVLEELAHPTQQIILRGPAHDMDTWAQALRDGYTPWRHVSAIPYEDTRTIPPYLPKLVSSEQQQNTTAYVCSELQCSLPITNLQDLSRELTK